MKSDTPKIVGAVVITAMILGGAYFVLDSNQSTAPVSDVVVTSQPATKETTPSTSPAEAAAQAESVTPVAPESQTAAAAQTYADGTYRAEKTYKVPEGHVESISVSVTVSGDAVTDLQIDTVATNDESVEYQTPFDQRIVGEVEGQDLDNADVSRLGGASLTSRAFNDLIEAIKTNARS